VVAINQLIPLINFSHKILNKMVCNSMFSDIVRINLPRLIMFTLHSPESHIKPLNATCAHWQPEDIILALKRESL